MEMRWLGYHRVARQHVCKRVVKLWGPNHFIELMYQWDYGSEYCKQWCNLLRIQPIVICK